MTEIGVIIALIALLGWQEFQNRKERAKLINAIMSKSTAEFRDLELTDKTEIKVKPNNEIPDLIETDQLNDEDWFKAEIEGKRVKLPLS